MKDRAIIVSGGILETQVVAEELRLDDFVIGVDRGVEFLYKHQIQMDYMVGDFDSLPLDILTYYKKENKVPIREYNPIKDASDTEMAVRLAMELGYQEITILGATGSRIDHLWANVQTLAIPFASGVQAKIIDSVNRIRIIGRKTSIEKTQSFGPYFSVFSLGEAVTGLTITGAKYSLKNHTLQPYDSLSVSNQIIEDRMQVSYESGMLLLMESKEA